MKIYYPKDRYGNEIGFRTFESFVYDKDGMSLTDKLVEKMSNENPTGTGSLSINRKENSTIGDYSVAIGYNCTAIGYASHAEGGLTTAGYYSHAEGYQTKATQYSHAEGIDTYATNYGHAEGNTTQAVGNYCHVEGYYSEAPSGSSAAHAEGWHTTASGYYCHAEGAYTTALTNQHAQGHYNDTTTATANSQSGTSKGTAFVIGNGSSNTSRANAFRVTGEGVVYATNSSVQAGADYAEYFEWADGNPGMFDRVGYFVTFDESNPEKIRLATENDYILGIVSAMPSVIGNGDECWKKRFVLDDFGRYIEETFEYEATEVEVVEKEVLQMDGMTGTINETVVKEVTKTGTRWKENPDYDNTKEYIPRKDRPEWDAIGMVGVLNVFDDGTCQVGGYCKCNKDGIATVATERGFDTYKVINRVNDNIIKVVLK